MVAMDVTSLQAYCLTKPGAWPDNPWDHEPVDESYATVVSKLPKKLRPEGWDA